MCLWVRKSLTSPESSEDRTGEWSRKEVLDGKQGNEKEWLLGTRPFQSAVGTHKLIYSLLLIAGFWLCSCMNPLHTRDRPLSMFFLADIISLIIIAKLEVT